MKALKTLTYAMAMAAGIAFCAPSVQAVTLSTTNDIILSLTLTVTTNYEKIVSSTNKTLTIGEAKLTNKNLLQLLGGGNGFSDETFSNGDQIAIAYDDPWDGDVVVVDKTGTNVLFDATENNGHASAATLAIDFLDTPGTASGKLNAKEGGSAALTFYDGGSFTLLDTNQAIKLSGSGPSAFSFIQVYASGKAATNNPYASWSDSATFNFFGAGESALGQDSVVINGTIKGKGNGKGFNYFVLYWFF